MASPQTKIENMILYFSTHPSVKSLGLTKLYKLIYFADVTHLRGWGYTISGSEYIKQKYGPMPRTGESVIDKLKNAKQVEETRIEVAREVAQRNIKGKANPNLKLFSQSEITAMHEIAAQLGKKTAKFLSNLSHEEPAWSLAKMHTKLSPSLMMYGSKEDPDGL